MMGKRENAENRDDAICYWWLELIDRVALGGNNQHREVNTTCLFHRSTVYFQAILKFH
jgi:hypothetical protein